MADPPFLTVRNLSKRYDEQALFEDISFSLHPGDKVALVARNGSGKTTLIKALAGLEPADSGEIEMSSKIRIGFVFQDPVLNPDHSVREAILDSTLPQLQAIARFEAAGHDQAAQLAAYAEMEKLHAWDLQQELQRVMSQLRLDQLTQPVRHLSGGQQRRIALARALLEKPDLLVLDEPTNHLDLDMIEWLENLLTRSQQTLFMVTHDRYFLEAVCNSILELEAGSLSRYPGNFASYLEAKAARAEQGTREREAELNLYRKELAWVRKQPRARGTKSRARVDAFTALEDKLDGYADAAGLQMEIQMQRLGTKILEIEHLQKAFGPQPILNDFSHTFSRGDRIGIIGRNGTGKSTFLNILTGREPFDSGSLEWGETVRPAYYRQQGIQLENEKRVLEVVRDVAEYIPLKKGKILTAAKLLERFLFSSAAQHRFVSTLSGGEKRRLYLLTLLMANPNFLILDEPTNDLDLQTIQVLEDFLLDYPGCLLVVSHDRYLMDKLVDHLFVFEGQGEVLYYPNTYSEYWLDQQEAERAERAQRSAQKAKTAEAQAKPRDSVRKLSFKEQRELESLDKDIEQLTAEKAELSASLAMPDQLGAGTLTQLSARFGEVENLLEAKELRWLELAEIAEAG
ncbi:MAG TPA: ABC-F family ATP-binding cassette domain-containing protein [Candidatus Obscuribacterales bacterium]